MVIFRLLGLVFILAALMALGSDAMRSLEAQTVEIRSLGEFWALLNASSYETFTGWVSGMSASMSDPVMAILGFPSWAVLGAAGIIIAVLIAIANRD
ncbi:MAG: hypothetical protein GC184_10275 [Rhizobiales bacterium]|nr:hypothetical protein [Hyphomicrobiales bacterium]